MIPPDAGREPRTDSPKFRAVATGDLISQKSQQGKEKVALCQLLWDKVGLHRLHCHKSPGPPAPNASYLVGVPTRIPLGRGEFRAANASFACEKKIRHDGRKAAPID